MLKVEGLHSGYGRVPILRDISLSVEPGKIVLVLGNNGAGKSTLMKTIGGFIKPTAGTITLEGRSIAGSAPEDIARLGLRLVLEGHRIFPEMSVRDNIRLGAMASSASMKQALALAEPALDVFPVLREKMTAQARELSGGQQQMLALAQAFVARPKVLLADETSLGLAQALIPPILRFLRSWADQGTAVLLVEQQIETALALADRAMVIERGEVRIQSTAAELRDSPQIRNIYLGLPEDDEDGGL